MAAPWTRHYDPEVPPSLAPYPAKTLVDYVRETADARPDAPAIFFKGTTLSNGDLDRLSDRFAASLVARGHPQGRSRRAGPPQLSSIPDCGNRRVESGRHGAAAQPALHGRRASRAAHDRGGRARRHAHAVLHAPEGDSTRDAGEAHCRDEHQGVSAAAASRAVHAASRKKKAATASRSSPAICGFRIA